MTVPLYEFQCKKCGIFERYLPMDRYNEPQNCDCGESAKKILSLPSVFVQQDCHYQSPIDGRPITNRKERLEDMRRSGCVEYDPGIKQDVEKHRLESERNLEKKIDETVEKEIEKMPVRKKEKLAQELNSGMTAEPVRL